MTIDADHDFSPRGIRCPRINDRYEFERQFFGLIPVIVLDNRNSKTRLQLNSRYSVQ